MDQVETELHRKVVGRAMLDALIRDVVSQRAASYAPPAPPTPAEEKAPEAPAEAAPTPAPEEAAAPPVGTKQCWTLAQLFSFSWVLLYSTKHEFGLNLFVLYDLRPDLMTCFE